MYKSRLNICVVGAGRAGFIHAQNYAGRIPGARLKAISDPDEKAARTAITALGTSDSISWYRSHTDALVDRSIDAFVVVTPTKLHRDIVTALAADGRHVFCEKPMAMTAKECDDMIAAAKKGGAVLQIGFMRRFDESYIKAKEAVESGAIGEVVMVRSNTRGPSEPQPWMYDLSASNGALAEVNSHDIDTLRWLSNSEFKTIYAIGGNYRSPAAKGRFPDFYDNVVLTAEMQNGVQGVIDGAQGVGYAYDARVEILGAKGCIFIGGVQSAPVVTCTSDGGGGSSPSGSGSFQSGSGNFPLVKSWRQLFRDAYHAEAVAFCNAIRNGSPPRVTGHDGKMAVVAVNAGNQSIRDRKVIEVM